MSRALLSGRGVASVRLRAVKMLIVYFMMLILILIIDAGIRIIARLLMEEKSEDVD